TIGLVFVAVAAGISYSAYTERSAATHSVEMSVSRLSCGSCVETIRQAVTALNGTASVETDVAAARSFVEFRGGEIAAEQIAETITSS
ncbi:MAG: heavy-metal-associated domain-containing protein, partial [Gammaproteobacteria bacterium]|nr:heavy-metal-associated domain-containing protein [Gammaproteobacteria bacterium]